MTYDDITLSDGSKIDLTDSNYSRLIESSDRNVHKQVFDLLYDIYASLKNTITSTGDMDSNITIAKLKGFKSACEASLYADNLDISIYDKLIDTVNKAIFKKFDMKYINFNKRI